jgi:peptide/nickel transport system permease protein
VTGAELARRLAHGVIVVLGVATIVFFATHKLGDPAQKMLPISATEQDRAQFRHALGLDRPLLTQYGDFLGGVARLDLGQSISRDEPAAAAVLGRLPNTLALLALSTLVALLIAIPLGIAAALRPGGLLDNVTVTTSLFGLSMPQFWLGSVLILVFAVQLKVLPTSDSGGIEHLVLPALAVGLPLAGKLTQMVRSTAIDELQRPYYTAARAKGLGRTHVLRKHVLRNAFVPVSSYLSVEVARALAGTMVVVETVFAYPGIGYLAVQALREDDLILIQAVAVIVALLVVVSNLLFDLLHAWVDPRLEATHA